MPKAATATRKPRRNGASQWVNLCPQLTFVNSPSPRSGRSRAGQSCGRAESNPVEQADNPDNPVEAAAQEAVQAKLDEQPDPVVEPRMPRYEEDDDDET